MYECTVGLNGMNVVRLAKHYTYRYCYFIRASISGYCLKSTKYNKL